MAFFTLTVESFGLFKQKQEFRLYWPLFTWIFRTIMNTVMGKNERKGATQ